MCERDTLHCMCVYVCVCVCVCRLCVWCLCCCNHFFRLPNACACAWPFRVCMWVWDSALSLRVLLVCMVSLCGVAPITGWQTCIGCLILTGHFPQESPTSSGSFAKNVCVLLVCLVSVYGVAPMTGWRRFIGCLIFTGNFSPKSRIISGFLPERDLQLEASYASSPPCSSLPSYSLLNDKELIYFSKKTNLKVVTFRKEELINHKLLFSKEPDT